MYRFIFPKMDKSFAVGTFGIVKCWYINIFVAIYLWSSSSLLLLFWLVWFLGFNFWSWGFFHFLFLYLINLRTFLFLLRSFLWLIFIHWWCCSSDIWSYSSFFLLGITTWRPLIISSWNGWICFFKFFFFFGLRFFLGLEIRISMDIFI